MGLLLQTFIKYDIKKINTVQTLLDNKFYYNNYTYN